MAVQETTEGVERQQVVVCMTTLLSKLLRSEQSFTEQTKLMEDLDLSSSQSMELLLELEGDLDVAIDVDDLDDEHMYTVGELADYIISHSTPA